MSRDLTPIQNYQDVARLVAAFGDDQKSISRAVYTATTCGAWAVFERVANTTGRKAQVVVHLDQFSGRWLCRHVEVDGVDLPVWQADRQILDWLNSYLWFPKTVPLEGGVAGSFCLHVDDEESVDYVEMHGAFDHYASEPEEVFVADEPAWIDAISFGSIVEGVDPTTETYTVRLPCVAQDIWDALDNVEREAKYIWSQTHGCEQCEADGWIGEWGYPMINPDCPVCHGEGEVI